MRPLLFLLTLICPVFAVVGQQNFDITSSSAGGVRLGMTLSQARRILPKCKLGRTSDGEGVALVGVTCSGREVMSLYAGEDDRDGKIDWKRRIEFIEIWDRRFKTADGVRPKMYLRDAERILGKVREIVISEIESREFVTFRKTRKGISYRTYGGIYKQPNTKTKKYEPGSRIHSIQVTR